MRRLSGKLVIIGIFVMMLTSFIPNILWAIFGDGERPTEVKPLMLLVGGIITVSFAITVYSLILEKFVIKRIKMLNQATKDVTKGHYDIHMKDHYKDEVSELVNNFNLMTEELQQNEYLNKDFIRNFSHEIKTPLATITGYTELLQHDSLSNEEQEEYTNIIIQESKRLSALSKNMLLISQLEHTSIVGDIEPFNITEQIRNIIQISEIHWNQKQQTFDLDVEDITIDSNKELLYHVFTNLIENAITFSIDGATIKIDIRKDNQEFICSVSNPGELTAEEQSHLFDLFYIKDKSRFQKSNGIGLTLVKNIVEKLRGTVNVTSENGRIIFVVALPTEVKQ